MASRVAVILFASVICSCMAIFAAGVTLRGMLGGRPYRMTLRPGALLGTDKIVR